MQRRDFLKASAVLPAVPMVCNMTPAQAAVSPVPPGFSALHFVKQPVKMVLEGAGINNGDAMLYAHFIKNGTIHHHTFQENRIRYAMKGWLKPFDRYLVVNHAASQRNGIWEYCGDGAGRPLDLDNVVTPDGAKLAVLVTDDFWPNQRIYAQDQPPTPASLYAQVWSKVV